MSLLRIKSCLACIWLTIHLSSAASYDIWMDPMNNITTSSHWQGNVNPQQQQFCVDGIKKCWSICNGHIYRTTSTIGYINISFSFDIAKKCIFSYNIDNTFNWISFYETTGNNTYAQDMTVQLDIRTWDQNNVSIKIEALNGLNDCCYVSEISLSGTNQSLHNNAHEMKTHFISLRYIFYGLIGIILCIFLLILFCMYMALTRRKLMQLNNGWVNPNGNKKELEMVEIHAKSPNPVNTTNANVNDHDTPTVTNYDSTCNDTMVSDLTPSMSIMPLSFPSTNESQTAYPKNSTHTYNTNYMYPPIQVTRASSQPSPIALKPTDTESYEYMYQISPIISLQHIINNNNQRQYPVMTKALSEQLPQTNNNEMVNVQLHNAYSEPPAEFVSDSSQSSNIDTYDLTHTVTEDNMNENQK